MASEIAADPAATDVKTDSFAEGFEDGAEAASTTDSSTDDTKTADTGEAADDTSTDDTSDTDDDDSEDSTDDDAADDTKEDDQPKPKSAEVRKEALNAEIRELVSKRNDLRGEVAAKNAAVFKPQTAEELEAAGVDPTLAAVKALEQKTQMAEYNAHVSDLNASLSTEALQVMHDFPVFDPESGDYNKSLADRVGGIFEQAAQVRRNAQTNLIEGANILPYKLYQAFAETFAEGAKTGKVSGQRATEKMVAAADPTSSSAPKTPKSDPFLAGLKGN